MTPEAFARAIRIRDEIEGIGHDIDEMIRFMPCCRIKTKDAPRGTSSLPLAMIEKFKFDMIEFLQRKRAELNEEMKGL